jgi:leader peptidase (prepilin peptidase) / N-methyltransferase
MLANGRPMVLLFAGLLGAVLGSFLNVCILRWGAEPKESVLHPPSRCPRCGRGVAPYDNIPIVSWLLLRGKCRGCKLPISPLYPAVELATAGIWLFMAWRFGVTLEALRGALFGTILLGIAVTDARAYIIPDEFTWGGLAIGLAWAVGVGGTWLFKQDAMGGGDIKMMAMVGAFVGWKGVLLTIFLGALLGTIIFLPLSLAGSKKLVPFGIFLALGAAAAYLVGPAIITWYRGYLGWA